MQSDPELELIHSTAKHNKLSYPFVDLEIYLFIKIFILTTGQERLVERQSKWS